MVDSLFHLQVNLGLRVAVLIFFLHLFRNEQRFMIIIGASLQQAGGRSCYPADSDSVEAFIGYS